MKRKKFICLKAICLLVTMGFVLACCNKTHKYREVIQDTPNITPNKFNTIEGVILHHTASRTAQHAISKLRASGSNVSSHVVIDTDGTRYVLASPDKVTWHAGRSRMNGRENCNDFTIGIEFQGNTSEKYPNPGDSLTLDQINSGIEYLLPIIKRYNIPIENIVTHEQVRTAYLNAHPNDTITKTKEDISPREYARFMKALKAAM